MREDPLRRVLTLLAGRSLGEGLPPNHATGRWIKGAISFDKQVSSKNSHLNLLTSILTVRRLLQTAGDSLVFRLDPKNNMDD